MGRWRRHLDPKVRRDVWTPQEDARLTQMVGQLGAQWSRICRHVKSRTAQQCRARCAPKSTVRRAHSLCNYMTTCDFMWGVVRARACTWLGSEDAGSRRHLGTGQDSGWQVTGGEGAQGAGRCTVLQVVPAGDGSENERLPVLAYAPGIACTCAAAAAAAAAGPVNSESRISLGTRQRGQ